MKRITDINSSEIEKEIANFEAEVNFEVVPVIARQSSYTEHIPIVFFFTLCIFVCALFEVTNLWQALQIPRQYLLNPYFSIILVFLVVFVVTVSVLFLTRLDFIKRFFISKPEQQRQVLEKAKMIFFEKRLIEIKTHNALLIFVSVMEKRIVILPDPRLNLENVSELTQQCLTLMQTQFKNSNYQQGLVDVIHYLKTQLKGSFPRSKVADSEQNEYSNKLIWWND